VGCSSACLSSLFTQGGLLWLKMKARNRFFTTFLKLFKNFLKII
jgi:hypothetical protein